jgi:hypothetical protein
MRVVVLDGYTLNPGDLSWEKFRQLGECVVYDRTAPAQTVSRARASQILLTNKIESNCSSYDCEFVALAHQLNTKFITQDKPLLTTFPATAISIDDFLAID